MRDVYTTGEVAKICSVSVRTVVKWIDSGMLPGYRIPGSQDRRVTAAALEKFAKDNDMPIGITTKKTILLVGLHPILAEKISKAIDDRQEYEADTLPSLNPFEVATKLIDRLPVAIAVDLCEDRVRGGELASYLAVYRADSSLRVTAITRGEPAADVFAIGVTDAVSSLAPIERVVSVILGA